MDNKVISTIISASGLVLFAIILSVPFYIYIRNLSYSSFSNTRNGAVDQCMRMSITGGQQNRDIYRLCLADKGYTSVLK